MDSVRVGVSYYVRDEVRALIEAVSDRVEVVDITQMLHDEEEGSPGAGERVDAVLGSLEVLFMARVPRDLVRRAPKLRWVQYFATGIEEFVGADILSAHFTFSNVTGTTAQAIAEHCFMFMLMFTKRAPLWMEHQKSHDYERRPVLPDFFEGKTVGILGMGTIGLEVARLSKAFGMRVLATRRSARSRTTGEGDVDQVYPPGETRELLAESDFVVLALPMTPETRRVIDEAALRVMKPTAYLINVGRGGLVDETVLVRALESGEIAGAGLDVFGEEPLPADSPLWDAPNLLMTPHVSGDLIDHRVRTARFFCEQLRRYLAGEPLRNVIDPERGY